MRLTSFTDYALRALIYLGTNEGRLVTKREISEAYGLSLHHVGKIVHQLGLKGYVEVKRGRDGGVRLARSADEIRLGDLVRDFEEMALVECSPGRENHCPITGVCGLIPILNEAIQEFLAVLDGRTLADVLGGPRHQARYRASFLVDD